MIIMFKDLNECDSLLVWYSCLDVGGCVFKVKFDCDLNA